MTRGGNTKSDDKGGEHKRCNQQISFPGDVQGKRINSEKRDDNSEGESLLVGWSVVSAPGNILRIEGEETCHTYLVFSLFRYNVEFTNLYILEGTLHCRLFAVFSIFRCCWRPN